MAKYSVQPTGKERFFREEEIIVSKTDLKGRITYANDVFLKIAGYTESDVAGQPHSLIRHPDMPRSVFKYLWDTIEAKHEIFAYVVNMARNGDHYWVFAHVTPTLDANGNIVGYHSNRRVPERAAVEKIKAIYADLLKIEAAHANAREGLTESVAALVKTVEASGMNYDELIFSL